MSFDGLFEEMIQPDKLHILSISVLLKELRRTRGGIAGNIAYSLAQLGEHPVLFASIGGEQREYMEVLRILGVDISHVHYSSLPSASFSVITDKKDCQVGGFYPGAMGDAKALSIKEFSKDDVLVVISAHDPVQMGVQIDECKKLKKRLCFDIGQQVIALSEDVLRKGIAATELLILNDYEMGMLAKRSKMSVDQIITSVKTCVITLGERGSRVYTQALDGREIHVDAVKADNVVDPTGAGDAFRAGFLYGYVRNWEASTCAKLGATVAAYAVEHRGTQEHTFTKEEITQRYLKQYQQELVL